MQRRQLLSAATAVCPLALLTACGIFPNVSGTSFDMAKLYADDLANAVSASAVIYLAGPPKPNDNQAAIVNQIVNDLQAAVMVLDNAPATTDTKSTLLQIISGVQQIAPLLGAALGPAAPYVPLAIAVIQAFIQSLPPPPAAPATPPAALHRAAMHYKGRG